jgi:hypothetical protein
MLVRVTLGADGRSELVGEATNGADDEASETSGARPDRSPIRPGNGRLHEPARTNIYDHGHPDGL